MTTKQQQKIIASAEASAFMRTKSTWTAQAVGYKMMTITNEFTK